MIAQRTLLSFLLLFPLLNPLFAQRGIVFDSWQEVVVFSFNSNPDIPWVGGYNSPQFSNLDINLDGIPDLLVFDRIGNRIIPLIHQGTVGQPDFRFAPEYISRFPALEAWVLALDYDGDGNADLFTHHPEEGIKVYRNTSSGADSLSFEVFNAGNYIPTVRPGSSSDLLKVLDIDIPGIADLDNDGDLDILSFDLGGSFIEYHKNMSVEAYGHSDSLTFVLDEACWGHVQEDGTINAMQLGVFCKGEGVEDERGGR
ncbi:MAG: VCBS repeat-containing protein, partial [Bacteroidota bacterium]